jgi:glycine/D-amino acid oxidase-like deaminating enzyme
MQSPLPSSVIVAGAGIVGASVAYFLAARGIRVDLFDEDVPAAQATGAADGAVSVASKRPGPMMSAASAGISLYRKLAHDGVFANLFKPRSTFIVAVSDAECDVLEAHCAALSGAGVRVTRLSKSTLAGRFSALSSEVKLAAEVHDDGHAIGYQLVHALLKAAGVKVRRREKVERFLSLGDGHSVRGVATACGEYLADAVVIASGSGSADLLGLTDTLIPRKGQLLITERAPALNAAMPGALMSGRYLLSKGSQKTGKPAPARGLALVIDPLQTGQFLIGGTREEYGDRRTNDIDAIAKILTDAVVLVPKLANVRLLRCFAGVRTAVIDGMPIVGRVGDFENLFVATGFEGDGICLGPIVGENIAAMICGENPSLDLDPFIPSRFPNLRIVA